MFSKLQLGLGKSKQSVAATTTTAPVRIAKPKVIIADIEGTTTPITFVKDVLFPFARTNVREFLDTTWTNKQTRKDVVFLWEWYMIDETNPELGDLPKIRNFTKQEPKAANIDSICIYVNWQLDKDRMPSALQQLLAHIWQKGYDSGQLKGRVFDDVPTKFKEWTSTGIDIATYSSSSNVLAQKLLFGNTTFGDLSTHITNYYDIKVGNKQYQTSYEMISDLLEVPASGILFLTDLAVEAKSALDAGMKVLILRRPGNVPLTTEEAAKYQCIDNFNEIVFA